MFHQPAKATDKADKGSKMKQCQNIKFENFPLGGCPRRTPLAAAYILPTMDNTVRVLYYPCTHAVMYLAGAIQFCFHWASLCTVT